MKIWEDKKAIVPLKKKYHDLFKRHPKGDPKIIHIGKNSMLLYDTVPVLNGKYLIPVIIELSISEWWVKIIDIPLALFHKIQNNMRPLKQEENYHQYRYYKQNYHHVRRISDAKDEKIVFF